MAQWGLGETRYLKARKSTGSDLEEALSPISTTITSTSNDTNATRSPRDRRRVPLRDLERHEDCDHTWVRAQPSPEANCRNCHFYCHVYAYRCQGCNYVACYVCRFHRLGR